MVKYKEFIREKLQKLNNLPKKWQQIIICILVIIVAIIYCFSGEEKTKIAVSEKVENKNTIISANGEDEEKNKNSKMIYNMDKDISTIKNPFSFEHEEKSDSKIICSSYRCLKSSYTILLGKPFLQIRIPSSTPLQVN